MRQLFYKQFSMLLSLCIIFYSIHTEDTRPLLISLGSNCQVALQLRKHEVRNLAFPFDWVVSSFEGVYSLFKNDFKDLLNPIYLIKELAKENQDMIVNTLYGIELRHDFPLDSHARLLPNYMDYLEDINTKYQERIKRLYAALNSSDQTYLIRRRSNILQMPLTKQNALDLRNLFLQKFPQGNWHIIFLDFTDEIKKDWHIERVKNRHMPQPFSTMGYWIGDDNEWKTFLTELQIF